MAINTQNVSEFTQSVTKTLEASSAALEKLKNRYQLAINKAPLNQNISNLDATMTLSLMIEHNKIFCQLLAKAKEKKSLENLIYKAYQIAEAEQIALIKDPSDYEAIFELFSTLMDDETLFHAAKNTERWGQIQYGLGITLIGLGGLLAMAIFIAMMTLIYLFVLPYLLPYLLIVVLVLLSPLLIASLACFLHGDLGYGFGLLVLSAILIEPMIYLTLFFLPMAISLFIAALVSIPICSFGNYQKENGTDRIYSGVQLEYTVNAGNKLQVQEFIADARGNATDHAEIIHRVAPGKLRNMFFNTPVIKQEFQEAYENALAP